MRKMYSENQIEKLIEDKAIPVVNQAIEDGDIQVLPEIQEGDTGKVLSVGEEGTPVWAEASGGDLYLHDFNFRVTQYVYLRIQFYSTKSVQFTTDEFKTLLANSCTSLDNDLSLDIVKGFVKKIVGTDTYIGLPAITYATSTSLRIALRGYVKLDNTNAITDINPSGASYDNYSYDSYTQIQTTRYLIVKM